MRVVGGSARGRPLLEVPGAGTRPIMDRVKTALFDTLRPRLAGTRVLDLFAGTGAVGIEALSQGAEHCTFLDLNAKAISTIRANLANTSLADRATVRVADALRFLKHTDQSFDLIYVAPPQHKGLWIDALMQIDTRPELLGCQPEPGLEDEAGIAVAQIDPRELEAIELVTLHQFDQKRYGNTLLLFFEPRGAS
jgi:16S rRNA (guanine(966)-N(2))-methyltransferase RsmD